MADSFTKMMGNASKQPAKKQKKPADPAKSVLRLPTPSTLRKETEATADEIDNTDPKAAKKYGKEKVKLLHSMVDADWHDGSDEQGEEAIEYFTGFFAKFGVSVFSLAVLQGAAFERCHEVMKALADSWQNMKSIPSRCDIQELFLDAELDTCTITADGLKEPLKFLGPVEFFADFWPIILWAAASNKEIGDELLYRWIKDAHEYGAQLPHDTGMLATVLGVDEVKDASGTVVREATTGLQTPEGTDLKKGHKRIKELFAKRSQWENLPSNKASYKRKRVMDRRFSGPKHLRTRDFPDFGISGFGFGLFS